MSSESSKTNKIRSDNFFKEYLSGDVIDIGGGKDPVTRYAEVFDLKDGYDAQNILNYKERYSYDCVYSSHCLEHMKNIPEALSQWWSLVKTNGYMIIVVPHEDLYEQGIWPSIFNIDHKATFRLNTKKTWSPISFDLLALSKTLPHSLILDAQIQDLSYDYNLSKKRFNFFARKIHKWQYSANKFKQFIGVKTYAFLYKKYYTKTANTTGLPIDQTKFGALAQIQIIIKKQIEK